jgi:hypothetical protein
VLLFQLPVQIHLVQDLVYPANGIPFGMGDLRYMLPVIVFGFAVHPIISRE